MGLVPSVNCLILENLDGLSSSIANDPISTDTLSVWDE
jgi:hypothetical protein